MCGIAGIVNMRRNPLVNVTGKMAAVMRHRGPNAEAAFEEDYVLLEHCRLSIIDLSTGANQPFSDKSKRFHLVFNGEIYNFKEIKSTLVNYSFETESDTEVLLAAYVQWGTKCLDYFKGMFSFVIWDSQQKMLFAARDRLGVKPFYYFLNDEYFVFGSEVRSIIASGLVQKKLSKTAVYDFLSYQSIGFPFSPIENIRQLEAGCYLTIQENKVESFRYWRIAEPKYTDFDFSDKGIVLKKIRDLLLTAVERRLVSDVPLGAFLSGGIDSSVIVGLMTEASSSKVNTFNISFEERSYDESSYAEIIARKFNTNHTKVLLRGDLFLAELTNALDAMDSPTGDGINTYVVSKAIRSSGLTVALSGIGGDELFAGYPFFKQFLRLKKMNSVWSHSKLIRQTAAMVMGNSSKSERLKKLLQSPKSSIKYFYPEFRRILARGQVLELTNLSVEDSFEDRLPGTIEDFPLLSQVSIAEYLGYTQNTLLKDTDQMSMAVSLEVREPFFDHDLIDFVLNVPDKLKFPTYPKQLLVESVNGLLPNEIVFREKQGFLFPWNVWMKAELRAFCEKYLSSIAKRDFIKEKELMNLWKRFLNGDKSVRWMEIWLFVILGYWMEKNGVE